MCSKSIVGRNRSCGNIKRSASGISSVLESAFAERDTFINEGWFGRFFEVTGGGVRVRQSVIWPATATRDQCRAACLSLFRRRNRGGPSLRLHHTRTLGGTDEMDYARQCKGRPRGLSLAHSHVRRSRCGVPVRPGR